MDCGEAARRIIRCGDLFQNKPIINPIMMRFRPIAPKPVAGAAVPSVDTKNTLISKGRTKRKYVRVRKYNRKKKSTNSDDNVKDTELLDQSAVTSQQLLPESRDGIDFLSAGSLPSSSDGTVAAENPTEPSYLYGNGNGIWSKNNDILAPDPTDSVRRGRVGELWVTVECVTDACMDLELQDLGSTDEERINKLEADTCPGFVTDSWNRVQWLNEAFKRMARQRQRERDSESPTEIAVWLNAKARVMANCVSLRRGFTCRIKLQYKWGMERESKVVPCDVWRMDGGGFAWKLDVKAALTLGPPLQD